MQPKPLPHHINTSLTVIEVITVSGGGVLDGGGGGGEGGGVSAEGIVGIGSEGEEVIGEEGWRTRRTKVARGLGGHGGASHLDRSKCLPVR